MACRVRLDKQEMTALAPSEGQPSSELKAAVEDGERRKSKDWPASWPDPTLFHVTTSFRITYLHYPLELVRREIDLFPTWCIWSIGS